MTVTIKKYANRKLYDEKDSAYLSMLELADLAAKNPDILVTCDRTGRDITLETLSRALNERLKAYAGDDSVTSDRSFPFPVEDLVRLIARVPSRTVPSRTVPSKTVPSRMVPSRTVPSRTVPSSKRMSSKTALSKTASLKAVPAKVKSVVGKSSRGRKS